MNPPPSLVSSNGPQGPRTGGQRNIGRGGRALVPAPQLAPVRRKRSVASAGSFMRVIHGWARAAAAGGGGESGEGYLDVSNRGSPGHRRGHPPRSLQEPPKNLCGQIRNGTPCSGRGTAALAVSRWSHAAAGRIRNNAKNKTGREDLEQRKASRASERRRPKKEGFILRSRRPRAPCAPRGGNPSLPYGPRISKAPRAMSHHTGVQYPCRP